jgi:hypothetical protein
VRPLRVGQRVELAGKLGYVNLKQLEHRRERYHPVTYLPLGRVRRRAGVWPPRRTAPVTGDQDG